MQKEEKQKNEAVTRKLMRDGFILKKAVQIQNRTINLSKHSKGQTDEREKFLLTIINHLNGELHKLKNVQAWELAKSKG